MTRVREAAEKRPGCCTSCGLRLWPADAPAKFRTGWRLTYMLANGSLMDLTVGDCCAGRENLDAMWDRVLQGWLAAAPKTHAAYVGGHEEEGNFILARLYGQRWWELEGQQMFQELGNG